MKEVIWTEDFVHKLEDKLRNLKDFEQGKEGVAGASARQSNDTGIITADNFEKQRDTLIEELLFQKESEGEELFYQEVFDSSYSVLDYLNEDTPLFFFDYDRLGNAQ